MTPRERFLKVINFEKPDDRMPMVEWAACDLTLKRWQEEGMPDNLSFLESQEYFGLDPMILLFSPNYVRRSSEAFPSRSSHNTK